MRILIAEDDVSCRKILMHYLLPFGSCDAVEDGQQATDTFRRSLEENNPYTLVCLDIYMPEMDGIQARKLIRQMEKRMGPVVYRCRIVMITAVSDTRQIIDAYSDECDGYIIKPFDRHRLAEHLKLMGLIEQPETPLAASPPGGT